MRGPWVIALGIAGIFIAWAYSAPSLQLSGKGVGEFFLMIAFGLLPAGGAAWLQSGVFDLATVLMAIPLGIWVVLILWINEVPDRKADAANGKRTLVVRLGLDGARVGYRALHVAAFAAIVALVVAGGDAVVGHARRSARHGRRLQGRERHRRGREPPRADQEHRDDHRAADGRLDPVVRRSAVRRLTPMPDAGPLHLVFGASGYIGTHLVPVLQAAGKRVRATARNVEVLEAREWHGRRVRRGRRTAAGTLERALAGVDTAFYLVHSMAAGRGFGALDRQAAENFGRAAAHAGVRRIVYLGGLIPVDARSEHLRSRAETGDVLRASGVPVTELRAGMIIGPGSAAYEVMRDLVNHLPIMTTPRWVRSRSTPIALDDLLAYLDGVAGLEAAAGRTLDVAGPEAVTYEQIMRCYGRQVGRHPRIIAVPVLSPRISSYWLRLVTSVPVGIARALVEGLEHDFVARDDEIRRLVPRPLLGLEDAIREAREADQRHAVVARWVEGSIACRNFRPEYAFYAKRAGATAQGDVAANDVFARALLDRRRRRLVLRRRALVVASCRRLARGRAEFPASTPAPDATAPRRRRRFVARDRARAGPEAHADDGNERARRGRARVRGAAATRTAARACPPRPTGIPRACRACSTGSRSCRRTCSFSRASRARSCGGRRARPRAAERSTAHSAAASSSAGGTAAPNR